MPKSNRSLDSNKAKLPFGEARSRGCLLFKGCMLTLMRVSWLISSSKRVNLREEASRKAPQGLLPGREGTEQDPTASVARLGMVQAGLHGISGLHTDTEREQQGIASLEEVSLNDSPFLVMLPWEQCALAS